MALYWQNYLIVNNSVVFVTSIIADSFVSHERVFRHMNVAFGAHSGHGQQIC